MDQTAVVVDREFLKHDPGERHPERPERIGVLLDLAAHLDGRRFRIIPPRIAHRADIESCHGAQYVQLLEATSRENRHALDGDTVTCRDSFGVGLLAVGGFLQLLDGIAAGEVRNGMALIRPPGHHALPNRAMGFCLFNTIAIGTRYLKRAHGAKRILIVDWDVHHGNGTQDAFYEDPSVLFISTHQYPFYPGTGAVKDVGVNAGAGYTINIPLPEGCADAEYLRVFRDIIIPAASRFAPEWVLVSAGFDAHRNDPLGGMGVTEGGFSAMAQLLLELAEQQAGAKIALVLEGGYDLEALRNSVAAVLQVLQRRKFDDAVGPGAAAEKIQPLINKILQVREKYS